MFKVMNEYGATMRIFEDEIEEILEYELSSCIDWGDMFDEYLNEIYPSVDIYGVTYYPADIMRNCDPGTYDYYCKEWYNDRILDLADEVRYLSPGETFEIENLTFEALEDGELVGA